MFYDRFSQVSVCPEQLLHKVLHINHNSQVFQNLLHIETFPAVTACTHTQLLQKLHTFTGALGEK